MDIETLSVAKKYTANSVKGMGAIKGDKGDNATINGVNTLTLTTGEGLKGEQSGNTFSLSLDTAEISKQNLLDNPDFLINQTGIYQTLYKSGDYFCDRWKYIDGTITFNADYSFVLNGTIAQILEEDIGDDFLAYANAGTAAYDPSTRTYTITANGETIKWAMLIKGKVQIPFNKSNPATTLMRCQRHSLVIRGVARFISAMVAPNSIDFTVPLPTSLRYNPTLVFSALKIKTINNVEVDGFTFVIAGRNSPNSINVRATKTAHGLTAALLEIPSNAYMKFDANL